MPEIDTFNKFLVASGGDDIVFLQPVPRRISKPDALLLAAYLVAIADDRPARFPAILAAVETA